MIQIMRLIYVEKKIVFAYLQMQRKRNGNKRTKKKRYEYNAGLKIHSRNIKLAIFENKIIQIIPHFTPNNICYLSNETNNKKKL